MIKSVFNIIIFPIIICNKLFGERNVDNLKYRERYKSLGPVARSSGKNQEIPSLIPGSAVELFLEGVLYVLTG